MWAMAANGHTAAGGRDQIRHEAQQGALATPGRPNKRDELALVNIQCDVRKGMNHRAIGAAEFLVNIGDRDNGFLFVVHEMVSANQ